MGITSCAIQIGQKKDVCVLNGCVHCQLTFQFVKQLFALRGLTAATPNYHRKKQEAIVVLSPHTKRFAQPTWGLPGKSRSQTHAHRLNCATHKVA